MLKLAYLAYMSSANCSNRRVQQHEMRIGLMKNKVCMFIPCMCGFSLGIVASSHRICMLASSVTLHSDGVCVCVCLFLYSPVIDWNPVQDVLCLLPIEKMDLDRKNKVGIKGTYREMRMNVQSIVA